MTIGKYISDHLLSGKSERTGLMLKNVIASFFIKGWSLVVQILLVPVALDCLTTYEYGIWLVMSSVLAWMDTFDIGLGNGLRNKLAEALARNDNEEGRVYISTTYVALIVIAFLACVVCNILVYSLDVYQLLNVDRAIVPNLQLISSLLLTIVCFTFVVKGINAFYLALQLPAVSNLIQSVSSTLSLIGIGALALMGVHSLICVTLAFVIMPLIALVAFTVYAFGVRYRQLCPSLRYFDRSRIRPLVSLSVKFFIGQLAGIILMLTANVVITNALSPEYVSSYQVAYRYYSLLLIPFSLIATPLWGAATDAYVKNDIQWIRKALGKMELMVLAIAGIYVVMYLVSDVMFHLWVGDKVVIDGQFSGLLALYMLLLIWGMCYSSIMYGIGKVNLTVFTVALMSVVFLCLAYPLTKEYGLVGLVSLQIIVTAVCMVQTMVECKMILRRKS